MDKKLKANKAILWNGIFFVILIILALIIYFLFIQPTDQEKSNINTVVKIDCHQITEESECKARQDCLTVDLCSCITEEEQAQKCGQEDLYQCKCNLSGFDFCEDLECSGFENQEAENNRSTYVNRTYSYSVRYPSELTVTSVSSENYIQFLGEQTASGYPWPTVSITHYSKDELSFPLEQDPCDWIRDNIEYDELGEERIIGDQTAVHIKYFPSSERFGSDSYYFLKDGHLFWFYLFHVEGNQDWEMYNAILDSFKFIE